MLRKTYDIIRTFVFHFFLAKRCTIKGVTWFYVFKLLTSLYLRTLWHPDKNKVITFNLLKYKVSAYGYGDLLYLFKEIFLNNDYYFETSNEKPLVIDCGANIGMSILYFKLLFPKCSIIAFEPNPFAFDVLKWNVDQNGLTDVRIINAALSDKTGSIKYFLGENKGSLVGSIIEQKEGDNVLSVPVAKLSDFIQNQSFDFIKIDIEGAEWYVLKDLVETVHLRDAKRYTVEYHHDLRSQKSRLSDFLRPFEELGYGYTIEAKLEEKGVTQNILIKLLKD